LYMRQCFTLLCPRQSFDAVSALALARTRRRPKAQIRVRLRENGSRSVETDGRAKCKSVKVTLHRNNETRSR
jgi:hypothetical protein